MGAGTVATGDKGELALGDGGKGVLHGGAGGSTGRVGRGAAEHEVVVDEGDPLGLKAVHYPGEALFHEAGFLGLGVDQDQVGIAVLGGGDGLAGTGGLDLHLIAVLALEHGQQVVQQAGVLHGGGGGQADGLGLLGSSGDLPVVDRGVILHVEQVLAIVLHAEVGGHVQGGLAQQPVDQGVGAGGVHRHIGNGIAVGIGKGCLGVHGDNGVGVEHAVVSLIEDLGVNGSDRLLRGSFRLHSSGSLRGSGGLGGGRRVGSAAGAKAQDHHQGQQESKCFFHVLPPS